MWTMDPIYIMTKVSIYIQIRVAKMGYKNQFCLGSSDLSLWVYPKLYHITEIHFYNVGYFPKEGYLELMS